MIWLRIGYIAGPFCTYELHRLWVIELFHQPTLMHNFYSLTICLLHYYPRRVSSINMPIFRRKNCIHTASGIFAEDNSVTNILLTNKNCALKLVDEIILYYDARSKKRQRNFKETSNRLRDFLDQLRNCRCQRGGGMGLRT